MVARRPCPFCPILHMSVSAPTALVNAYTVTLQHTFYTKVGWCSSVYYGMYVLLYVRRLNICDTDRHHRRVHGVHGVHGGRGGRDDRGGDDDGGAEAGNRSSIGWGGSRAHSRSVQGGHREAWLYYVVLWVGSCCVLF